MAEMNIKQIIDRLNAEFTGDTRKLVFWYDDNGEDVYKRQDHRLHHQEGVCGEAADGRAHPRTG